ncbi:hypothetical protein GGR51DRAFT_289002 [Nemania sp. FL0031]|nr:hypothetical protein GGR51DRAFT_289002 [Nemania sp. FL0031]
MLLSCCVVFIVQTVVCAVCVSDIQVRSRPLGLLLLGVCVCVCVCLTASWRFHFILYSFAACRAGRYLSTGLADLGVER